MERELTKIKPGVPTEIGVTRFATARAQELKGMAKWIGSSTLSFKYSSNLHFLY